MAIEDQVPESGSTHQMLLLLLGLDTSGVSERGVSGITRLQKLLFLLWKEAGLAQVQEYFDFKPYKAGPYSRRLYDELEFLENIGLVRSEVAGEATDVEAAELEEVSFEQLMGNDAGPFVDVRSQSQAMTPDAYEEKRFTLTAKGLQTVRRIIASGKFKVAEDGIRRIKTKFGNFSLQDLLYHVYTKYEAEGWTSASEIKQKVLSRGA